MKDKGTFFWQALLALMIVITMFSLWTVMEQREVIAEQNKAMHSMSAQLTRDEYVLRETHQFVTDLVITLAELTGIQPIAPAPETLRTEWRMAE